MKTSLFFLSSDERDKRDENSQTPLSIRKFLMIPHQMFLIPRIFFDIFIIFDTVECHLAETVVICNISPVLFLKKRTLAKCNNPFFPFLPFQTKKEKVKRKKKRKSHICRSIINSINPLVFCVLCTCVHLLMPYLAIKSFVNGAEMRFICMRYSSSVKPGFL